MEISWYSWGYIHRISLYCLVVEHQRVLLMKHLRVFLWLFLKEQIFRLLQTGSWKRNLIQNSLLGQSHTWVHKNGENHSGQFHTISAFRSMLVLFSIQIHQQLAMFDHRRIDTKHRCFSVVKGISSLDPLPFHKFSAGGRPGHQPSLSWP